MVRLWVLPGTVLRPGARTGFSLIGQSLRQCSQRRTLFTLGIETSCDDTCVAVLYTRKNGRFGMLYANERISCANEHHRGIHPVEAVESHTRNLPELVEKILKRNPPGSKPGLIAVTRGPGMKPCLNVGISFAKALSVAWDVPLVGVHHMQAHALSIQLDAGQLWASHLLDDSEADGPKYPFLNLLVSGGHTMLVYTKSAIEHRVLASTQRGITNPSEKGSATAVGEMLDKCARDILPSTFLADRPKPHGAVVYAREMEIYCKFSPYLQKMLNQYKAPQQRRDEVQVYHSKNNAWGLPPPLRHTRDMKYDFAGLGGKVRAIMQRNPEMEDAERSELAYQTMRLAFEHIMSRVILALENDEELLATPPQSLVISGGVASNTFLRTVAASMLQARGFGHIDVRAPRPQYCTDNAAMVAWAGQKMYQAGWTTDLSFLPQGEWPIEEILTGVDCWVRKDGVKVPEPKAKITDSQQQDRTELPESSEPKEPPLPSTPDTPPEPVEVAAPDAGAAHRHEAKDKAVTQNEGETSQPQIQSDHNEASAKPVPGRTSSNDGQHSADSEGPAPPQEGTAQSSESPAPPQEGTAQSPPNKAVDHPPQSLETPWARAPQVGTMAVAKSVHGNRSNPVNVLKAAEEQLLKPLVQGSRRRAAFRRESPNGPRDRMAPRQSPYVKYVKSRARAGQVAKRQPTEWTSPAVAVQKKSADKHGQVKQVSGSQSADKAQAVSSSDVDQTPKPRTGPFGHTVHKDKGRAASSSDVEQKSKPRTGPFGQPLNKPVLGAREAQMAVVEPHVERSKMIPESERVSGTDQALKESGKIKEKKHEHKQTGDQKTPAPDTKTEDNKTKRRVVRRLPVADEPAPKGSLGMGLDKLKRWIGL